METIKGRRVLGSTRLLRAALKVLQQNRPAKLCYLLMAAYGRDSGECYASEGTLAQDLGSSARQVRRYLRQLSEAGFLAPRYVPGRPTRWSFLWHPSFDAAVFTPRTPVSTPPRTSMSTTPDTSVHQGIGSKEGIVTVSNRRPVATGEPAAGRRRRSDEAPMTTKQLHQAMKAEIWGYFQGERKRQVDPPDADIVRRCVKALHGCTIEELRGVLRDRFRLGYRPGQAGGPRSYAWFVRVIDNAFGPR